MFGKAFDGRIVRRIWSFVRPYRRQMAVAVAAVLVFTLHPARHPADHPLRHRQRHGARRQRVGADLGGRSPSWSAILINYGASYVQEIVVGRVAENVLFDMRRAMFAHLQRVSLSFMDKTEVGRLMSRLQGDVNSMQEFLETSVLSVGDIVLLVRHRRR